VTVRAGVTRAEIHSRPSVTELNAGGFGITGDENPDGCPSRRGVGDPARRGVGDPARRGVTFSIATRTAEDGAPFVAATLVADAAFCKGSSGGGTDGVAALEPDLGLGWFKSQTGAMPASAERFAPDNQALL